MEWPCRQMVAMTDMVEKNPSTANACTKQVGRRTVLKTLARTVALPTIGLGIGALSAPAQAAIVPTPMPNPRWFGFNLLEYFSTDPDWMKYFPFKNDGAFLEDDFRWIRDWGFNFVRLPMDYRFWTSPEDLLKIDERKIEPIDRAIRLGEKYGIHVSLCLHRAPGFCILDDMDAALTGIHVTPEKTSLYEDVHTLEAFAHQWTYFAKRYQGISSKRVSFNLVNEPMYRPSPERRRQMLEGLKGKENADADQAIEAYGAKEYARVASAAIDAIRAIHPGRTIVADGFAVARSPVPELFPSGVIQSPHTYCPPEVTTYKAEWARQWLKATEPPTWPLSDKSGKVVSDRKSIDAYFEPWRKVVRRGVPIHVGELGCYKFTPPEVVLAWFDDTLDAIGELNSGWTLWNFRGPFGILDTQRAGTKYEEWHGHHLDRPLLKLLQKKMTA